MSEVFISSADQRQPSPPGNCHAIHTKVDVCVCVGGGGWMVGWGGGVRGLVVDVACLWDLYGVNKGLKINEGIPLHRSEGIPQLVRTQLSNAHTCRQIT